jgi:hypothetical protein
VSEIPFVNALGDAIERAAAQRRGRVRRRLLVGGLGIAIAASGVAAAAGVFESTPEQLATSGIGCYDRADLKHANVTVLSTGTASPTATCRRVLHVSGPMVACAGPAVLVFPGPPGTCERLGYKPLAASYFATRRRVNALARKVERLETSADCWEPQELSRRVRALLERTPGWSGWTTKVQGGPDEGPCGSVSHLDGAGGRGVDGAFDAAHRLVLVTRTQSRSLTNLLFTAGGPGTKLMDATGERCYDVSGLEALARRELPGHALTFAAEAPGDGQQLGGSRGERYAEGCAVIVGYSPARDGDTIAVEVWAER